MFFQKRAEPIQLPRPFVVPATGKYEGNDGNWSTFSINIGDDDENKSKGQNFGVLISTSSSATLVPQQTEWCDEKCAQDRGIMQYNGVQSLGFDSSIAPVWENAGTYGIPRTPWWNDPLGTDSNKTDAIWGISNVGMGESSPESVMLSEQYVVKYTIANFFLGHLGLAVGWTGPQGATKPNFIDNFYGSAHEIPSRSFGYTAGAYYRESSICLLRKSYRCLRFSPAP